MVAVTALAVLLDLLTDVIFAVGFYAVTVPLAVAVLRPGQAGER